MVPFALMRYMHEFTSHNNCLQKLNFVDFLPQHQTKNWQAQKAWWTWYKKLS